jgi:hypothetical protein
MTATTAKLPESKTTGTPLGAIALVCLLFAMLNLVTALLLWTPSSEPAVEGRFPQETLFGPLEVPEANTVYQITIVGDPQRGSWAGVTVEILDADKSRVMAFSKDLYFYTGMASDGPWVEEERSLRMPVTLPRPGAHFLRVSTETVWWPDSYGRLPPGIELEVFVERRLGSSLPHFFAGILLLLIAVTLNELRNRSLAKLALLVWRAID